MNVPLLRRVAFRRVFVAQSMQESSSASKLTPGIGLQALEFTPNRLLITDRLAADPDSKTDSEENDSGDDADNRATTFTWRDMHVQ